MNRSRSNIVIKAGFFGKRDLERELKTPKAQEALHFVAGFLGYTVKTPIPYGREIEEIQGVLHAGVCQQQLETRATAAGLARELL